MGGHRHVLPTVFPRKTQYTWYSMLAGHFPKISSLPGLESRNVQSVAIRSADYSGPLLAADNDGKFIFRDSLLNKYCNSKKKKD
jgi:hypothetical protein